VSSVPAQADSTTGSIITVKPGHRAATGPERVFTLAKIIRLFRPLLIVGRRSVPWRRTPPSSEEP
jgi:hypothetical protein